MAQGARIFCADLLEHGVVEHRVRQKLLQPLVLLLQLAQPPGLGHLQSAISGLPLVEGCRTDPMAAAHIRRRHPRLLLLQNSDDLLLAEPAPLHSSVSSSGPDSTYHWRKSRGSDHRHQEWLVQEDVRRREEDRRRIAESVAESTADLQKVISRWTERTAIERILQGVEERAASLPEEEKAIVLQRLAMARNFLGTQDPLDFFRGWQTPEERYSPRFPNARA